MLRYRRQAEKGFVTDKQKKGALMDLRQTREELEKLARKRQMSDEAKREIEKRKDKLEETADLVWSTEPDVTSALAGKFSDKEREMVRLVLEQVYEAYPKVLLLLLPKTISVSLTILESKAGPAK